MFKLDVLKGLVAATAIVLTAGCLPEGIIKQGAASGPVSGSAGGGTSVGAAGNLERCTETLGTLAVDDGRDKTWWSYFYRKTQITTIEPMIRLLVQQSNCFVVTSIGNQRLDSRMSGITSKQRSGEFRAGSNQHKGQRVAADYYMEPAILFSNSKTGQMMGAIGGLLGNNKVGGALGGLSSSSSSVTLSLFDIRSGIQISASEGSSSSTNFGAALGAFGRSGGGGLSGYTRTPEGKATLAAFVDSYNKMVVSLKNYKAQEVKGGLGTGGRLGVGN